MHATIKHTRSGLQVAVACGTLNVEAARTRAAHAAAGGRLMIVIGIVRSAVSKCWYLGLARYGEPLTWISVHRRKRDAEQQMHLVLGADQEGDLKDDVTWEHLLQDLAAGSEQDLGDPQAEPPVVSRGRPQLHWPMKARAPGEGT